MSRKPGTLSMEDFGDSLLRSLDLDPLYVSLIDAQLPPDQLKRWLLAYWCGYSAGCISWIADAQEPSEYWNRMEQWAENTTQAPPGCRWPRGRERRHFRGKAAITAVAKLKQMFPNPEDAVNSISAPAKYTELRDKVTQWPLFGPWIAFKVGDMMERIVGVPIVFDRADVMYSSPVKAAKMWAAEQGIPEPDAIDRAVSFLDEKFGGRLAPPRFERQCNLQEFETILCKWGAHRTGFYPPGIDTHELKEGLEPWAPFSDVAKRMLEACPGAH